LYIYIFNLFHVCYISNHFILFDLYNNIWRR
jgi:hypothetical protein